MLKYLFANFKEKTKSFIKNKKGSDDKNTGSAMAMIFAVVIGFLLLTSFFAFYNTEFFPSIFQKILDGLNYSG